MNFSARAQPRSAPPASRQGRGLASIALLLALTALPLLPSLFDPFFADDYLHIERLDEMGGGDPWQALRSWVLAAEDSGAWWVQDGLEIHYFRPVITLSFALDHLLWGLQPFGYHLTNLLLHLAATLVCLEIFRLVLGTGRIAWLAALFFGIHPAHTEAVVWISGRTDLLCGLFYSLSFLCFLRSHLHRSVPRQILGQVLFCLALLTKEMAVTLPAVLLLAAVTLRSDRSWRHQLVTPAISALLTGVYLVFRVHFFGGLQTPPYPFAHGAGAPDTLIHLVLSPFLYLGNLVLFVPADPVLTYPFWLAHPILLFVFLLLICGTFAGTVRRVPGKRLLLFGLGWMILTVLPVLIVSVGERFLYIPSIGYCVLVASRLSVTADRPAGKLDWPTGLILGMVLAVFLFKNMMFGGLADRSRLSIEDALGHLESSPRTTQLFVIDLPSASTLAFPHALRLGSSMPELDVEVLSVTPDFFSRAPGSDSLVTRSGPSSIHIERSGGIFFASYVERAFLAERPVPLSGERFEREGFTVTIGGMREGHPAAFEVEFTPDPEHRRSFLLGRDFRLERIRPLQEPVTLRLP